MILGKKFYQQNTLKVAQGLLGCVLIRKIGNKIIRAVIVETEAYMGEDDLASHASKGRTPRTELMYGQAGHAYVYMIYGMYYCLNVVTEKKDFPAAVLIRGAELLGGSTSLDRNDQKRLNLQELDGPGKLCKFLQIDRKLNGFDLTAGKKLWVENKKPSFAKAMAGKVKKSKRVGIDYAKHCKEYLWRFTFIDYVEK